MQQLNIILPFYITNTKILKFLVKLPDSPKEDQFYKSLYELNKTLFYNKLNEKLDKKDSVSNFKKKI